MGRDADARRHAERALAPRPSYAEARWLLSTLQASRGRLCRRVAKLRSAHPQPAALSDAGEAARRQAEIAKGETGMTRWSTPGQLEPVWNLRARRAAVFATLFEVDRNQGVRYKTEVAARIAKARARIGSLLAAD